MSIRTDLAMEAFEMVAGANSGIDGVKKTQYTDNGFEIIKVEVLNKQGAQSLGKPMGKYITIDLLALINRQEDSFKNACEAVSHAIEELLDVKDDVSVLVAGLGNRFITPDAIGPKTAENTLVTRHLVDSVPEYFCDYRRVSSVIPGVLAMTGVETGEVVQGVIEKSGAGALIAVDALASRRLSRLLHTIQLSNTGIVPGSGVGNARCALNEESLGIKVIAIGVPTVVDGKTIAEDIRDQTGVVGCEALTDLDNPVIVTTKDIDSEVTGISRVIGYGINMALNRHLSIEDIDLLLS